MKYLYKVLDFFKNKKHIEAIIVAVITVIIIGALIGHQGKTESSSGSASSTGDAVTTEKPFITGDSDKGSDSSSSSSSDTSSDKTKSESSASYKKEKEGSDIHDLLTEYYKDYAAGDIDALEKAASPVSDMEKSYIKFMSKLLDSYDIKEIYTKDGATEGSKLVSVYVQMHFKGLKSAAPGLDFFYVETDDSGALHINNLYSSFNQTNKENAMDPSVVSAIASFEEQKDVVDLQTKVQQEYNEISLSDKDFEKFMSKTYPSKVKSWQTKYRKNAKKAAAKKAAEEKKAAAKKAEEEKKAAEKAKADTEKTTDKTTKKKSTSSKNVYKTTTKTNLRKKATINSDIIKTLGKGTKVTKISGNDKWLKVSYKGKTGYIRKMYLKKVSSSSSDKSSSSSSSGKSKSKSKSTSSSSGPTEGKKLVLKDTVNVRKKPSTSSKRINLAYKGDKILVIKNRDDGWTKIQYHNSKGYVKTEFLK